MIGIGTSRGETSFDMMFLRATKIWDFFSFKHKNDAMSYVSYAFKTHYHYCYPQNIAPLQWSLVPIKIFPYTLYSF